MVNTDGILNVIKPRGRTSFEVTSLVRRWSGKRRVGHGGTLDPCATGVLPICLGQATRTVEFLADSSKTYRGEVELGVATDTYDASGRVIRRQDPSSVSRDGVEEALSSFVGDVEQKPPMYSAIKYEGKRLYELARAGIEVERGMRKVYISRLELVSWQPPFLSIEVECGKGTYIRALAHDLGQALGCGAHLKDLVRLRCGIFDLESGIALPQLEDAFCGGYWQHFLYPIDQVLLDWDAAILGEKDARLVRDGRPVFLEAGSGDRCRAYTLDGRFLSVLRWEEGGRFWHPDKVFAPEP